MDSTTSNWTRRRSLKNKTPKIELLNGINKKLNQTLDLSNLTIADLKKLDKKIGSVKEPMPICNSRADYIAYLKVVVPEMKNGHRLSKPTLQKLAEEFNDKN